MQKLQELLEGKLEALPKKIKVLRSSGHDPVLIEIESEEGPEEETGARASGAAGELV
jgi:hypothetical protein